MMRIAILCSAHGFGHVTRQLAVGEQLVSLGAKPVFFSAAPEGLLHLSLPGIEREHCITDVGLVQRDGLHHDVSATLERLEAVCSEAAVDAMAARLAGFDRAVVDASPAALEACWRAGVPAVAVGNFDWAWVYGHYPQLRDWAQRFARWQSPHPAIALTPGPGMSGFRSVETVGIVARRRKAQRVVGPKERGILVSFGGFGLSELSRQLPRLPGVRYILSPPMPPLSRPDCVYAEGIPYPALVAGAAAVLTKPGYGILAEASLAGTSIVWVDRSGWPESAHLEVAMWARGDVKIEGTIREGLGPALEKLWSWPPPPPVPDKAARALAHRILDGLL